MKRFLIILIVVLLSVLFTAHETHAQWFSSPNVPIDDPVYRDIDKLVSAGLIKDAIYGQRPWSRGEIARLISQAKQRKDELEILAPDEREIGPLIMADEILKRLEMEYHEELVDRGDIEGDLRQVRFHPLEKVGFDYTILDSPFRAVPASSGLGAIDAVINPLVAYREGRHYVDGSTLGFETSHSARLSKFFSVYARPRFEALVPNTGAADFNPIVQQLYGKFAYRNLEIEVGRDSLIWGQGEFGGLLLTNNARPLDMIKVSSSGPFYHPWIFKYLGPSKYTFFVANLGPERVYANSFLYGFKVSIKPVYFLELGLSETVIMGGDGAPAISFWDPIAELFPLHKIGRNKLFSDISDHRFGFFDLRLTLSPLRNSVLFFDSIFEDSPLRAISNLDNLGAQMAFVTGINIPRLTSDGTLDLRLEYHHVPAMVYRHGQWRTGYTLNQQMIGDALGPDGDAIVAKMGIQISDLKYLDVSAVYESRDSDNYTQIMDPATGDAGDIVSSLNNPTEYRVRLESGLRMSLRQRFVLGLKVGYEHVWNDAFVLGTGRDNLLGSLSLEWKPRF